MEESHSCPKQTQIGVFLSIFPPLCFNALLKQSATVVGARLLADDSLGVGFCVTFIFCCIFRARFLPEISDGDKGKIRGGGRKMEETGGDGKKGDDLRRRQYLWYPNIGTANALEKSVALFRFSRVIFKQAPTNAGQILSPHVYD